MLSSWQVAGVPDEVAILITTVALGLTLAPWLGGIDVLGFKIPRLPRRLKVPVAVVATPSLLIALAAFYPTWERPAGTATLCGFFRNDFGPNNEWQTFTATRRAERFWIGCRVHVSQPTTVLSVETALGVSDQFFAGLSPQVLTDRYQLAAGEEQWLAVPVEPPSYADALRAFREPSVVSYSSAADGGSIVGELSALSVSDSKDAM